MVNQSLSESTRRQIEDMRRRSMTGMPGYRVPDRSEREEQPDGSSFFARLLISLLLLACFLQLHLSGVTFSGLTTSQAVEAVSQNVKLPVTSP